MHLGCLFSYINLKGLLFYLNVTRFNICYDFHKILLSTGITYLYFLIQIIIMFILTSSNFCWITLDVTYIIIFMCNIYKYLYSDCLHECTFEYNSGRICLVLCNIIFYFVKWLLVNF